MTQDEIIRMAREIAEYLRDCAGSPVMAAKCDSLCEQIALVAAHEREACAKVCEEYDMDHIVGQQLAAAIRAMGESRGTDK